MSKSLDVLDQKMQELEQLVLRLESHSADEELQKQIKTLKLLLYGAIAKMGIGIPGAPNNVLTTAQIPVCQVPANHDLQWEVSADGRTVLLYIVTVGDDSAGTAVPDEGDGGGEAVSLAETTDEPSPPPDPGEARDVEIGNLQARVPNEAVIEPEVSARLGGFVHRPTIVTEKDTGPEDAGVGDEFEDAIVVGMPEDEDDDHGN